MAESEILFGGNNLKNTVSNKNGTYVINTGDVKIVSRILTKLIIYLIKNSLMLETHQCVTL